MISKQMIDWGESGCSIREIAAYGERRAAEIGADAILLAKNIDGVYSADPKKDPDAKRYNEISYKEILANDLKAIDSTAASFGNENHIKTFVFELKDPENIYNAIIGDIDGTVVKDS